MQISRRDLYNRVWSTPMSKLARELDISDVGLAKACRRYNIPRPPRGYPYFLQEWGYQAWNHAEASPIGAPVIRETSELVSQRLDDNFFRVRFDRMTPREKTYLRAMAELGPGAYRTGDIADKLGVKTTSLAPVRANLIEKGMVFSPSHGEKAFTVLPFDDFMRRAMPKFEP